MRQEASKFRHAFNGFIALIRSEPHFRFHLVAAVIVIAAGFYFDVSRGEWVALCLAIMAVLVAEAINTSIEHLTDVVHPEFHERAGKVKDIASASVLLAATGATVVGVVVFYDDVIGLFS